MDGTFLIVQKKRWIWVIIMRVIEKYTSSLDWRVGRFQAYRILGRSDGGNNFQNKETESCMLIKISNIKIYTFWGWTEWWYSNSNNNLMIQIVQAKLLKSQVKIMKEWYSNQQTILEGFSPRRWLPYWKAPSVCSYQPISFLSLHL